MNIETPALVVDLDRLRANIERMGRAVRSRGLRLRPHAKTHKSLEVAAMQREAGADGLTVATLSEAEVFAAAGFTDLMVAYPVFPRGARADRLRRLLDTATLYVGVDNVAGATAVAEAARGRPVRVVLEVDSGQHRTGVDPTAVGRLAEQCTSLGLDVAGVFTHGGHSYDNPAAPHQAALDEGDALARACDTLRTAGFDPRVVSAGSTPTTGTDRPDQVTEERPGSYVYYDRQQLALGACRQDQVALSVVATVVSVSRDCFVVDAGSKALGTDRPGWLVGHGSVPAHGGVLLARLSEHHGVVEWPVRSTAPPPAVGDLVHVVPNHVCNVVNLFDEYVVTQDGEEVDRWKVAARGRNT